MPAQSTHDRSDPVAIFLVFLKWGCLAFGGPVAHLGYFQEEFVRKRRWLTDSAYADLVALCQFLPGPASSQVGFAIGLKRGGVAGAFAAWLGFTLPSALLMIGFALGLSQLEDVREAGWVVGLKLAAVAVVADAIWNMAAKLCPDRQRALIALGSAAFLLIMSDALWQIAVILMGGAVGWSLYRSKAEIQRGDDSTTRHRIGWPYLVAFAVLLFGLPLAARFYSSEALAVGESFYRAGSLVFGGGHVVLPLLDSFTVGQGWVDRDTFLAGYGAAQALPGPLFAFSSFLGASLSAGPSGAVGGVLALIALYLPSWLLVLGTVPYWDRLRRQKAAQAALFGANAAVVGLLLAAFYDPIWTSAVTTPLRLAFALVAFGALRFTALPPWALVLACAATGAALL